MARINIEDELFRDSRFLWLADLVGSSTKALGMLVQFWMAAQRRWGHGELLPEQEFLSVWNVLIDTGFAERRETGIYAKGAEEQFAWYVSSIEKGKKGGLASVAARKAKHGTAQPASEAGVNLGFENAKSATAQSGFEAGVNLGFENAEPGVYPPTPTPPLTHSLRKEEEERPPLCLFKNEFVEEVLLAEKVPIKTQSIWLKAHADKIWLEGQLKDCCMKWKTVGPRIANKPFVVYVADWLQNNKPGKAIGAVTETFESPYVKPPQPKFNEYFDPETGRLVISMIREAN